MPAFERKPSAPSPSSQVVAHAAACYQQVGFEVVEIDSETGDCAVCCSSCHQPTTPDGGEDIAGAAAQHSTSGITMTGDDERAEDAAVAAVDRLRAMLRQESDPSYARSDYLSSAHYHRAASDVSSSSSTSSSSPFQISCADPQETPAILKKNESSQAPPPSGSCKRINRSCRTKMIRWMFEVVDYCDFSRESVAVAASHLDRFLSLSATPASANPSGRGMEASRRAHSDRKSYQLMSLTALYVAIKMNEPVVVTPALLSQVSQGTYSESDLQGAELDLLDALGWRTSGPTALEFASHFLALLAPEWRRSEDDENDDERSKDVLDLVRYQIELSVASYNLSVNYRPSTIALAAIRNAFRRSMSFDSPDAAAACRRLDVVEMSRFLNIVWETTGIDPFGPEIESVMKILRVMLEGTNNNSSSLPEHMATAASGEKASVDAAQTAIVTVTSSKIEMDPSMDDGISLTSPVCVSSANRGGVEA